MQQMSKPPKNKRLVKVNALTQARLIKLLLDGDMACDELAQATGLHYVTVLQYTRELHRAGAAHVAEWRADGRGSHTRKVYKLGAKPDAKRPKLTPAERTRNYRIRKQTMKQNAFLYGRIQ